MADRRLHRAGALEFLAFDRDSVRVPDRDGRLHIRVAHISKANVCGYMGSEIPNARKLGLDLGRVYQLLRAPEELQRAAPSANNLPILLEHLVHTPDNPRLSEVCGSTGTDAVWNDPYLDNSLVFWTREALDLLESGERKQLSCSYHYVADMTPGVFKGVRFDGVMRNIAFNHTALVADGRVGDDIVVGDSSLESRMAGVAMMSPRAAQAVGLLAGYLPPKLAKDAALPDFGRLVAGVTAENWHQRKPLIAVKVLAATRGKLAKDASLGDLPQLLNRIDSVPEGEYQEESLDPRGGYDDGPSGKEDQLRAFLSERMEPDDVEAFLEMLRPMLAAHEGEKAENKAQQEVMEDDPPPPPREDPGDRGPLPVRDRRPGRDAAPPMPPGAKCEAKDTEEMVKPYSAKAIDKRRGDNAMDRKAMDSAIRAEVARATAKERQAQQDIREAERAIRPYIGDIEVAFDSAAEAYQYALGQLGVDHDGIDEMRSLRAILRATPLPSDPERHNYPMAADTAAGSEGSEDAMMARLGVKSPGRVLA